MARFTFTLNTKFDGAADTSNRTVTLDVPESEIHFFFETYRAVYGEVPVTPATNPPTTRPMTDKETYDKYASGLLQGTMDATRRHREVETSKTAIAGLPPPYTPAVEMTTEEAPSGSSRKGRK